MFDVARPVAIAATAGGHDDQDVIVRMRQNGIDTLKLEIYRVDDLNGPIGGLAPGQAGYAAAATARAYHTETGTNFLAAPGYGQFEQVQIKDVDQGDILAMRLIDVTNGHAYWAFAGANESSGGSNVTHLWGYGLNTWSWEDGFGGGDHDFNDLVVQLDFTSAAASAYIAGRVGGPGNDILANGFGGTSIGGSFMGNGGSDLFILRGDVKDAAIATLHPKASQITDFGVATDTIGLSPSSAAYANIGDPLAAYVPGAPVLPTVGNSGTHVALATAEVIKLATGVATTGLTLQQAFDGAIGNTKVTGLAADRSYFFTLYDQTNTELVIGIVQDRHGTDGTVEAGDEVTLVGIADMSATDYARGTSWWSARDAGHHGAVGAAGAIAVVVADGELVGGGYPPAGDRALILRPAFVHLDQESVDQGIAGAGALLVACHRQHVAPSLAADTVARVDLLADLQRP